MKSILTFVLLLASLTTYSQHSEEFSHKDLGLGYRPFPYTSSLNPQRAASPRDWLNTDPEHQAMVRAFAGRFSGQDSVVLTSSLLNDFAATRKETPGIYLFMGSKNGKLQVIITDTQIDTLKVNDTFKHSDDAIKYDSASNYHAMYNRAYYWNKKMRNWQLDENRITLKKNVLASRNDAKIKYGYKIQGYYLSKDLLLKIWKESGQESLTVFLGQNAAVFHLVIPISPKVPPIRVVHYATDYDATEVSQLPANPGDLAPPQSKDHNTIRPCPPYCGN